VKFDGYRVQAHKARSRAVIYSRNGHDFTERLPSIAQLLHELPAKAAVLDGEIVASDADGRPNFPGFTCVGPDQAPFTYGRSTCLRSTTGISACSH
jgi:hypothetical protein